MRLFRLAFAALALLGACGPTPHGEDAERSGSSTVQDCGGRGEPTCPPIMAERSAGRARFNEEYGISATFPSGAWVCRGESGTHPHGFYTRLGGERFECPPRASERPTSQYGVWADHNAAFYRTLEQAAPCRNGRTDTLRAPDGRVLALRGLKTRTCLSGAPGDPLSLWLTAFAGEWPASGDAESDRAPYIIYHAYLSTSAATLEADKVVLQRFLDQLVLTPPEPRGE